jgi:hypothetical protein
MSNLDNTAHSFKEEKAVGKIAISFLIKMIFRASDVAISSRSRSMGLLSTVEKIVDISAFILRSLDMDGIARVVES